MFQRLKGAIDNRIAEEQARQRQAQVAAQGRPTPRRRPQNPSSPAQRPTTRSRDVTPAPGEKQPDPSDFVIGDEDGTTTPAIEKADRIENTDEEDGQKSESKTDGGAAKAEPQTDAPGVTPATDTNGTSTQSEQPAELPIEVRTKLRRLEKLESKYGELLKAYRAAHGRVQAIDPFEAALKENTPLTGIGDPASLVEYLNQIKLKGDMVLDELKRVTTERNDIKKKFEQSEKDVMGFKVKSEELEKQMETLSAPTVDGAGEPNTTQAVNEIKSSDDDTKIKSEMNAAKSPPSSRIGSFSLFSPRLGTSKETPKEPDAAEDLFSYDSELPRIEQELQERTAEVEDLSKQVRSLKSDLSVARESTSSMVQTLETATRELNTLRDEKDRFEALKAGLQKRIAELEHGVTSTSSQTQELRNQIQMLENQKTETETEIQNLQTHLDEAQKAKAELETKFQTQSENLKIINEKLSQKDHVVKDLEDSLAAAKLAEREQARKSEAEGTHEKKLATMRGILDTLRTQLSTAEKTVVDLRKDLQAKQDEYANKPSTKIFGHLDEQKDPKISGLKSHRDVLSYLAEYYGLRKNTSAAVVPSSTTTAGSVPVSVTDSNTTNNKKKNKKKKKAGKGQHDAIDEAGPDVAVKVSEDLNDEVDDMTMQAVSSDTTITALETEISELKTELKQKTDAVERLSKRIKDQEALQEEIETLRDDLLHQGEEHVEARDALKTVQETADKLKVQLEEAKKQLEVDAESEKAHAELSIRCEELKAQSDALQRDLSAAESLATSRFKDITDLKELLSKAQPELRQLRSEVTELKTAKEDLKNKEGELKRLESRHEDLKSEMKGLSKRLGDKDSEIKELQTKIEQETKARNKVENDLSSAQLDARVAENKRKDTSELLEQRQKDLTQSKEEAANLRRKLNELEDKVSDHSKEILSLKEEVTLKTALHSSSQSLLQSLRDQTHELSMQSRESSSRAESLEEELTEAQRMLSERTRESQTMRMLLDQAQNGVEARIREMKERMETAIEERDRVEDEANVRDRRLMREVEDARNKMRDAQRRLKTLEDERDDLETRNRDWRRRREELEQQSQDAKKDADDVKQAMKSLRDALDESERQVREVDTQKSDLRRQIEETNDRFEKLTRANKNLSEEIRKLQDSGAARKGSLRPAGIPDSGPRSSRTSIDSTRSPAPPLVRESSVSSVRPETPTGGKKVGAANAATGGGLSQGNVDYVYLKNVLLQFMEQKDKSHQRQLVPVLAMLLHFDRKDEQKWMAAIGAR